MVGGSVCSLSIDFQRAYLVFRSLCRGWFLVFSLLYLPLPISTLRQIVDISVARSFNFASSGTMARESSQVGGISLAVPALKSQCSQLIAVLSSVESKCTKDSVHFKRSKTVNITNWYLSPARSFNRSILLPSLHRVSSVTA